MITMLNNWLKKPAGFDLVECGLPNKCIHHKKLLLGEVISSKVITNPYEQFKIEVYFVVLDQVNIASRF